MPLGAGTRLGPYEVVSLLGAGGMGEVYRAHDTRLGRDVAVKVLTHGACRCAKPWRLPQQLREASRRPTKRGIAHRDLKPANVFLLTDGQVKILDFGLARSTSAIPSATAETRAPLTDPGTVVGTAGYMAPEQIRGAAVDGRADLFALGALLYEMLTGVRAFRADSTVETLNAVLTLDPLERRDVAGSIPPGVEGLVRHCLEKQPDERFQSARDLAFQLQAFAS